MRSLPLPLRVAAGLAATAVEQARELPAKLAGLPVTVASQALQLSMRVQQHVTELAIKGDQVLAGLRPVAETPEWATFDEDLDENRYDAGRQAPFDRVDDDWRPSPNGYEPTDLSATTTHSGGTDSADLAGSADSADLAGSADLADPANPANLAGPADMTAAEPDPWAAEERALAEETAQDTAQDTARDAGQDTAGDAGQDATGRQHAEGPAGVANYVELSLPQLRARLRRFTAGELAELLEYERTHGNRPAFVGMLTRRLAAVNDNP